MKLRAAIIAAGALLTGLATTPFANHPYTITAYFLSAEGLTPQNDVVINGSRVGKVVSVGIAPDAGPSLGGAQVVLEVDGRAAPLHRGTRATVRPKGLLGNPFVELTPGSPGSEVIPSGGTLPLQDTASPVDLDNVLAQLAAGLKGHERDLNQMLRAMPSLLDELQALSDHSATSLAVLDPCMADIVQTLAEMRSAQAYRDATGNLLGVHPYIFTGTEPVNPARLACSGGQ